MHAKAWITRKTWPEKQAMLIGSANLTQQGLRNNFELMAEARHQDIRNLVEHYVDPIIDKSYDARQRVVEYINNGATRTRQKNSEKTNRTSRTDERRVGNKRGQTTPSASPDYFAYQNQTNHSGIISPPTDNQQRQSEEQRRLAEDYPFSGLEEASQAILLEARRRGMTPEDLINTYRTSPTELPAHDKKRRQRSRGDIGW